MVRYPANHKKIQETGIPEIVPVFPPALRILNKYTHHPKLKNKKLLPVPTNKKVNTYLKELADICGIETRITFQVNRHTFASTVTLDNGIPIDSVSKMLGHRSIKTTQIYAKVSTKKISEDTNNLFQKFHT
ncbi:MAG: site-specific integrase [Bacteroidota bacterium]